MVTSILDKLLQSQFGKSFIFWVFLGLCSAVSFLAVAYISKENEIRALNELLLRNEQNHSNERDKAIREQILIYQNMLYRIQEVEKKRKK